MKVEFKADESVFTVFAAFNACGYDDENRKEGMHPVRIAVREELKSKYLTNLEKLKDRFNSRPQYHFTVWALWQSDPPDFIHIIDGQGTEEWLWSEWVEAFGGFDVEIRQFWYEADIHELWTRYLPEYQKEIERYKPLADAEIAKMLAYLRMNEMPEGRKVVYIPNLLDAYWRGYGPTVQDTTYVVAGPSVEPNMSMISHEAMHSIVNPLVEKHSDLVEETEHLYALVEEKMKGGGYGTWVGTVQENIVRAIDVQLESTDWEKWEELIANEERRGFIFVRGFCQKLEDYERSNKSFEIFVPELLDSLRSFKPRE